MTEVSGSCGNLEQNITLQWNNTANVTNNFVLHFIKNETTKQYSFHHLELSLTEGSKNCFIRKYLSLFININYFLRSLSVMNFLLLIS